MFGRFRFRRQPDVAKPLPSIGGFGRVYAVGDVHGRFDLFVGMLRRIAQDLADWEGQPFQIIFLGDLIDRGEKSKDVLDLAVELAAMTDNVRFLAGNHEEVFLRVFNGDEQAAHFFYQIGGRETLKSYGLQGELDEDIDARALVEWMQHAVPAEHVALIESFEDIIILADYVFVHAGIRPKTAIEKQRPSDLRWIRDPFLEFEGDHPGMIIHGHSITDEVDERHNRIGIDTGAYRSGKLTAVVLEKQSRRFLTVQGEGMEENSFDGSPLTFFDTRNGALI